MLRLGRHTRTHPIAARTPAGIEIVPVDHARVPRAHARRSEHANPDLRSCGSTAAGTSAGRPRLDDKLCRSVRRAARDRRRRRRRTGSRRSTPFRPAWTTATPPRMARASARRRRQPASRSAAPARAAVSRPRWPCSPETGARSAWRCSSSRIRCSTTGRSCAATSTNATCASGATSSNCLRVALVSRGAARAPPTSAGLSRAGPARRPRPGFRRRGWASGRSTCSSTKTFATPSALQASGVSCQLDVVEGAFHGFDVVAPACTGLAAVLRRTS